MQPLPSWLWTWPKGRSYISFESGWFLHSASPSSVSNQSVSPYWSCPRSLSCSSPSCTPLTTCRKLFSNPSVHFVTVGCHCSVLSFLSHTVDGPDRSEAFSSTQIMPSVVRFILPVIFWLTLSRQSLTGFVASTLSVAPRFTSRVLSVVIHSFRALQLWPFALSFLSLIFPYLSQAPVIYGATFATFLWTLPQDFILPPALLSSPLSVISFTISICAPDL